MELHRMSSSVDRIRVEMLWDIKAEKTIELWKDRALQAAEKHQAKAYRHKRYHTIIGLAAIITPIAFAVSAQLAFNNIHLKNIISIIGFGMSSLMTAVFGFLRLEIRMQNHFDFNAKYEEYAMHMTSELTKPKAFRTQCDVFLKESELRLIFIDENAPP